MTLEVSYPTSYPDVLPEMSFIPVEGEVDDLEQSNLLEGLKSVVSRVFG